ncbi:penicillin-binding protein activator [Luteimonas sp. 3794]|uniref:penicillin-binding protein activator n=1 Tax=Luteimonas sp. 3794 TaxID=2817730 RepID=UPI002857DC95|nr:penicillin-binding protein activator [Luteimonas sp. 3794]MDR6991150.1 outer membrane PBP1 activator LpoA protein [Luteimonas sp. 3794]
MAATVQPSNARTRMPRAVGTQPRAWRLLAGAALAAMLASCATVQTTGGDPAATPSSAPAADARWAFDDTRPAAERDGYRPARKLAVLLPMSGTLATAAAPVRDGLLAGYYGERRERPELAFYDTAGTAAGTAEAYRRAIAEGADQIVGPLGRDEVDALFRSPTQVPVLALNRGSIQAPDNAAAFSLAPEDEGDAAAQYLLKRNARHVLVLSNGEDAARRSVDALTARLAQNGGSVVSTLAIIGDSPLDQVPALQNALASGTGVDAVYLAIRGNQARVIAPQLSVAGLATRPRLGSSLLTQGTGKAEEDQILDGIVFPTESWSTGASARSLPPLTTVARDLPTARGGAARLFAFGFDAWLLSGYLEHLARTPDAAIGGATGMLRIAGDGNVMRQPAWATWRNGQVVPQADAGG